MLVERAQGCRMIHPAGYKRGGHTMLNGSSVSFSGSVATILLASGFLLTLEAQQPLVSAPSAPVTAHNAFVTRYCASCHNDRLKRGGLTLDAVAAQDVDRQPEVWEKV